MASSKKITIEIIAKTYSYGSPNIGAPTNQRSQSAITPSGQVNTSKELAYSPLSLKPKEDLGSTVLVNQAFNIAKNVVKGAISTSLNQYFKFHEDYIGENIYNNAMTSINKVASLGATVAAGASVGGAAGAIIAGAGYVVSDTISLWARLREYQAQLNATNFQTSYSRTRAGLVDGGKGTEN